MKRCIVITTINSKTQALCEFEKMEGWHVIVVGDLKSKPIPNSDRLTFLSVEDQRTLGLSVVDQLPYNHYTRKNVGYLYAISHGAEVIFDTDDDNLPYSDWEVHEFHCDSKLRSDGRFANAYQYFTGKHIWPRGFPLDAINRDGKPDIKQAAPVEVGAWQGLADKDPDVDAIYRLVVGGELIFERKPPVVLERGCYCPFNSQNTAWNPKAFPYLYLPSTVSFRFTDILRGYVAQRLMWEQNLHLGFCRATVYQERNSHDLMKDFKDEIECYLNVQPIVGLLDGIHGSGDPGKDLLELYARLAQAGFVKGQEVEIVRAWLADYESALNRGRNG